MAIAEQIKIVEVGPRDGLQNESAVSVDAKVTLIEALADAGPGRHLEGFASRAQRALLRHRRPICRGAGSQ